MAAKAASFLIRGESPSRIVRSLAEAARQVSKPSGALVFVSAKLGLQIERFAEPIRAVLPGLPAIIASGHGVLSERGEVEGDSAAAGIVWSGGSARAIAVSDGHGADLGVSLLRALEAEAKPGATAFAFVSPRGIAPHTLEPLAGLPFASIVGGGVVPETQVLALEPGQASVTANAAALVVRGLSAPGVIASPACRLLTPLARITATRGPMVLEIEGERALDLLSASAATLKNQPLILVALAPEPNDSDEPVPLLLRGLQGVDPGRHGIVISDEVRPGLRLAFATRDAAAARVGLEASVARVARENAGAAPHFGVYINCAGRGSSLYQAADVDTRIIRGRLPELPFAGMHSSFEIGPHGGKPTLQLYTGVLSVFTSPS